VIAGNATVERASLARPNRRKPQAVGALPSWRERERLPPRKLSFEIAQQAVANGITSKFFTFDSSNVQCLDAPLSIAPIHFSEIN
jgi:hypothetical protein